MKKDNEEIVVIPTTKTTTPTWKDEYVKDFFDYSISDVDYLLRDANKKPPEDRNAGPTFMVIMNGISSMSGILYGFNEDEGDRFVKFMVEHMDTIEPVAIMIYHSARIGLSRMSMPRSHIQYGFFKDDGTRERLWAWKSPFLEKFDDHRFVALNENVIILHVGYLAELYLEIMRELQKQHNENPDAFPADGILQECEKGKQSLDAACVALREDE